MPPVSKMNKKMVLDAAFGLTKEKGIESVNARQIAQYLNCSTQPIFSVYKNMGELKQDLILRCDEFFMEYFHRIEIEEDYFLKASLLYIDFALEEPNLFKFLLMSDHLIGNQFLDFIDLKDQNEHIAQGIPPNIDFKSENARTLFLNMWLYAHGLATMLITNKLNITKLEIKKMVTNVYASLKKGEKVQ